MRELLKDIGINPDKFSLYNIFVAFCIFLLPIAYNVIGIVALILIDFITSIIAAKKTKEKITSAKMSRSIYKTLVYILLLITALISDRLIGIDLIVKFVTLFLSSTELLSVGDNFQRITNVSFVSYLKDFLESKVKGK